MIFNNFEKRDRQIFTVALILLVVSLGFTVFDDWVYRLTAKDIGTLESIGSVQMAKQDVRRRYKVDFGWNPLRTENKVYQGDSIFTGPDSSAIIKTLKGEEISIAPNSLVVINSKKDSLSIDIGFGSFEGRVAKGTKLLISSNNKITELDGNNAKIKIDAGGGDKIILNILDGQVKVKSGGAETTLGRNDSAELDGTDSLNRPDKNAFEIISPLADQRFRYQATVPVEFKWKSKRTYHRSKIKVSTRPDLEIPLLDAPITGSNYLAYGLPADQKLYWQILGEGGQSDVGEFWLLDTRPPNPVLPLQGMQFFFDPIKDGTKGTNVELKWSGGSPARRYQVQISTLAGFSAVLLDQKTEKMNFQVANLGAGEYYWRIRGLEFPDSPWSEPGQFKVSPEPSQILIPPRPEFQSELMILTKVHGLPANKVHILTARGAQSIIESAPRLEWSKVAGAQKYELQISDSRNFRSPLVSVTTTKTDFTWTTATPGAYYWRIRSSGEGYKAGVFSSARPLKVKVAAPIAISNPLIVDEVPDQALLQAPPPPITIRWNPTVFTKTYEVSFSKNSNFSGATRFITASADRQIQMPAPGKYFWKVRSLDKKQNPVSDESPIYTFEFQRTYKDPTLSENLIAMSPKQGESILLVGQGKSEILFQWNRPLKKAQYELQISYDIDFSNIAHDIKLEDTRYIFKEPLQNSVVYWRVRASTNQGSTPWTGANRFLVSYEKNPFDSEISEKLYFAKLRARERQKLLLAQLERRIEKLRTPAGASEIQLSTPVPNFAQNFVTIEQNIPDNDTANHLSELSMDESFAYIKNPPLLTWEKVPAGERYFIEIAKDPKFKEIVIKAPSLNNYYAWDSVRPGQFYWRVQAFNNRYTRSEYSPVQSLRAEVPVVSTTSPDNFVEILNEPREMWPPPSPFTLEWSPRVFAKAYELEFGENADFTISKTFRVTNASHEVRVSKIGTYFWRVRPVNEYGIGIARWTPTRSIEVAQAQRLPASEGELTGLFPTNRTMLYVGKGLMNLVFHFLGANDSPTTIEVSDTPNFEKVLAKSSAKGNKLKIQKDLPEGLLYWRLSQEAGLRGPASSTLSKVYQFILRKESEPYINPDKDPSPESISGE